MPCKLGTKLLLRERKLISSRLPRKRRHAGHKRIGAQTGPAVQIANVERPVTSEESERRLAGKHETVSDLDVCMPGLGLLEVPAMAQASGRNVQS